MKRIFFIIAIVLGIFMPKDASAQFKGVRSGVRLIPANDTVIVKGETVHIGAYLRKGVVETGEVENFGISKKSDIEKGFFRVKVSPKKTTSYRIHLYFGPNKDRLSRTRTIYVVKSEKEKKAIEEKMIKEKVNSSGLGIIPGSTSIRIMDDDTKKDTTKNKTHTSHK